MNNAKKVPPDLDGVRLDAALTKLFAPLSRRSARQAILRGELRLNGKIVKIFARQVKSGDTLALVAEPSGAPRVPIAKADPLILHEDAALVVIAKPAQLLSERGPHDRSPAVPERLEAMGFGKIKLVHRLDAGTSGVMVVARTDEAALALSDAFRRGEVEKSYLLTCAGVPGEGVYAGSIQRDKAHPRRFTVSPSGKSALTRYRTLSSTQTPGALVSVASARPKTGRTHQIRVHFADAGHPLLGDALYKGPRKIVALDGRVILLERPQLHALGLCFTHPTTGARRSFVSLPPPDFSDLLTRIGAGQVTENLDVFW